MTSKIHSWSCYRHLYFEKFIAGLVKNARLNGKITEVQKGGKNILVFILAAGNKRLVSWLKEEFANPGSVKQHIFISWNGEEGFACQVFLQKHLLVRVQGGRKVPDIIFGRRQSPEGCWHLF